MKKTILSVFILFSIFHTNAQTIIFYEPFDAMAGYSITGWPYQFSGVVPWQCGLPYSIGGGCMMPAGGAMSTSIGTNKIAGFAECTGPDHNDSNVLTYTPIINLSSYSEAWLRYDSYFSRYTRMGDTETATVEISTDNGSTWTVLEHVAPNTAFVRFETHYINLGAYAHASNIRIGFRYNDGGGYNMQGWAIDNVCVFKPFRKDLSLLAITPTDSLLSYVQTGYGFSHDFRIFNAGLDTIHSFSLNYRLASGAIKTNSITGLALLPFSTTDFTHAIRDSIFSTNTFNVTAWVTLDSDEYHANDTAFAQLRGADFIPHKALAIESGEGTYNGWTPRNMYYLKSVVPRDIDATLISVHEADPMTDTPYHDYMLYSAWNYVPYIQFDRRLSVPLDSFFDFLDIQKNTFGFADVNFNGTISGNSVTVSGSVTPAINMDGDHRLALVITEDGVTGTTAAYDQVNNYASGLLGPMDGYETRSNPVPATDMVYNYVGRQIYPNPEGMAGALPTHMLASHTYNFTLTTTIDPAWQTGKLKANVLLIRHADSSVLNSNHMQFYLSTTNTELPFKNTVLYPNPANETAHLSFDLTQNEPVKIIITDLAGRLLYEQPEANYHAGLNKITLPISQFSNGIYLVNLFTNDGTKSLKLEILH